MAHELSTNAAGKVEAMFAGQVPWHGLGTLVPNHQSPIAALHLAHLDWAVVPKALYLPDGTKIDDKVAMCRDDSGAYLGTVGTKYTPVQNEEQARFIEDLCGTGEATVECVGALFGGRKTFWTCKLPKDLIVGDGDAVKRYLILTNAHDGTMSFRAFWSPIRVVCNNTLNAAMRQVRDCVCILHFGNVMRRVDEARTILGVTERYYDELGKSFAVMLKAKFSKAKFESFLDEVFPIRAETETAGDKASATLAKKVRDQVAANFHEGRGADMAGRTAWGAYNAVTEYACHQRKARGDGDKAASSRFENIYFGTGRDLQQKAYEVALELAGV